MEKAKKIEIINGIIERAENCTHENRIDLRGIETETKVFIDNNSEYKRFLKEIEDIQAPIEYYGNPFQARAADEFNFRKNRFLSLLRSLKSAIDFNDNDESVLIQKKYSDKVFIVHGHDEAMKLAVKDVITSLKLTPIILHEQPNKGSRTIIEKFEQLSEDVGFAIVLLSADDEMKNGKFRARQNVILELGYFVAKLGRDRVIALYDTSKEVDIPSDISGVLYEPYDNSSGAWRYEIVQELKAAKYPVSADDLIKV